MSYRPVVRVCAAAALTLALGTAAAVPAAAHESAAAAPDVLVAVARDLGLTVAEAEQRLLAEQAAAQQEQRLAAELGESYRGAWLDATGALVVSTSDAAEVDEIVAAGARPQVATGADPQAALDALNAAARPQRGVAGQDGAQTITPVPAAVGAWFVDEASGQVVLQTTDLAAGEQFKARAGALAGLVRVEQVAETPRPFADVVGGDAILAQAGGRCSVGFSARSASGTPYVVTAGHCTEIGGNWNGANGTLLGPVAGTSFPTNDYGVIRVSNTAGWTLTSQVRGTSSVLGSTVAAIGASTCRSGSTTGYRCGTIQARNVTVNYGGGDVVSGLTQTTACAQPGDSGGSYVAGRQAQGVLSGGSGNCSVGGTTFYQPLNEILGAYGLTLVTG